MKHSHWLVLYDICDPKRLRQVEKLVSQYGTRIQKSVFEFAGGDDSIDALQRRLKLIIKEDDFVAIVPLCETDWQKIEKYGMICQNEFIKGDYAIL